MDYTRGSRLLPVGSHGVGCWAGARRLPSGPFAAGRLNAGLVDPAGSARCTDSAPATDRSVQSVTWIPMCGSAT
jgi:hypothetical protein